MGLAERVRAAVASYWTAGLAWAAMSALHWRWLWRSTHAGDVLSAYGAGLVVLGVLIGSRPYIAAGTAELARRQANPEIPILRAEGTAPTPEEWAAFHADLDEKARSARREIIAERVVAVAVVVMGTLLNAWGTPLARRWGLLV